MKRLRGVARSWNRTGLRLAASVLLSQVAPQTLAAEALMFVKEWRVAEGTHVIAVFDDGAAYHLLAPNDSNAPDACANHRRISLSLLTSYDYAGLRRSGEPDLRLDPAEVSRHWRAATERPMEHVAKADARMHGNVSCTFAVVGKPIDRLTELRLLKFKSLFFEALPRAPDQQAAETWLWQATYDLAQRVTKPSFQR